MLGIHDSNSVLAILYIEISFAAVIFDIWTAYITYKEQKKYSGALAITCVFSGMVQVTYLVSILATSYRMVSLFSSLYFISVDLSIVSLLIFVRAHTKGVLNSNNILIKRGIGLILAFDVSVLLLNVFNEVSVHYVEQSGVIGRYAYEMKPLYWFHLAFTYILVVLVLFRFFVSAIKIPREYRRPLHLSILSILFVVGLNGLFLYFPGAFGENNLDYSTWGYSISAFLIYYNCFRYPATGMKAYYHGWIVQNISQAVALFNYEDSLIIYNEKFHQIFPDAKIQEGMTVEEFSQKLNLYINNERSGEDYSFQHYVEKDGKEYPIRFEHRCLRSNRMERLGQLFVFTDEMGDVDLLTAFFSWSFFNRDMVENPNLFQRKITIAVCDLNGLHEINTNLGKNVGDRAIEALSLSMRKHFPRESYFVRGPEATLIAICFNQDEQSMESYLEQIQDELIHNDELGCLLFMQSAVGQVDGEFSDIQKVLTQTFQSMRNKKLLDENSYHSELVTSLVKTLSECDSDTEAHVKRTQILGAELGKRLGLSDRELSDLALLCVLHDIGKIGIPLEILNKPDKLTDSEWRMMKSHVLKGYQIASTSRELSHIAEFILHHHESWNGKGYPDGLSKESIPLLSRIIAVVDSFDAMVSDRPYRSAMSVEAAIKEIHRCAGEQFDPRIVNEFLHMINEDPSFYKAGHTEVKIPASNQVQINSSQELKANPGAYVHKVNYTRYVLEDFWNIIAVDEHFEQITGYSQADVYATKMRQVDLIPEEDQTDYLSMVMEQKTKGSTVFLEHRLKKKDGSIIYVHCVGKTYYDSADKKERISILVYDSFETYSMRMMMRNEKQKAEVRLAKWENKYRCDSLTGLLNHEAYKNDIELILLKANVKIVFLMLDIDHFKEYNDRHGHRMGDEFLVQVAQTMTSLQNENDLVCRMGGDEFSMSMIYEQDYPEEAILKRASQVFDKLNMIISSEMNGSGISIGLAVSDNETKNFNTLYERADQALYKAKENGRNRMVVWS